MGSHRVKPKTLSGSAEFLRITEDYHRKVMQAISGVRVGTPHFRALDRLGAELRDAYCAISGDAEVPWARGSLASRFPGAAEKPPSCG